jgi:hypothetical protein
VWSLVAHLESADAQTHINKLYRDVKSSQVIKKIMITSANLAPFKVNLSLDAPMDTFIRREPGATLIPLEFTSLDLKLIWNSDVEQKCLKFMLSMLQHTFKLTYSIYDVIYSPDVNIAEFSDMLIGTISSLRKQIPRCDKAFDVIEKSVNLLRGNFKDYFRQSVESENPSTILESFIIDVASTQKANPKVVSQFRRITAFVHKHSANNNDPRLKQLFRMLNMQYSKIDDEMATDTRLTSDETTEIEAAAVESATAESATVESATSESATAESAAVESAVGGPASPLLVHIGLEEAAKASSSEPLTDQQTDSVEVSLHTT